MKYLFSLIIFTTLFFPANSYAESQFQVGQKFTNFIQLEKNGDDMQVALPKGEWEVAAIRNLSPTGNGSKRATVFLFNIADSSS
jgi:hypothetical protein